MNIGAIGNRFGLLIIFFASALYNSCDAALERVKYNNPGLVVDLGVGLWAWPLPMDYDSDGDYDLVVCCPDKPYNGTYFFENGLLSRQAVQRNIFLRECRRKY
ncbi:MAG: hypothetical protein ACYSWW_23245 [Planctomycetota bacterium]